MEKQSKTKTRNRRQSTSSPEAAEKWNFFQKQLWLEEVEYPWWLREYETRKPEVINRLLQSWPDTRKVAERLTKSSPPPRCPSAELGDFPGQGLTFLVREIGMITARLILDCSMWDNLSQGKGNSIPNQECDWNDELYCLDWPPKKSNYK